MRGRVALLHVEVPVGGGVNLTDVGGKPAMRFDTHCSMVTDADAAVARSALGALGNQTMSRPRSSASPSRSRPVR